MKRIRYVEIEKFKTFGDRVHIDLGHPAVLIGPNNAGKTSVIQALALWNRGIKAWYEKKGQPRQKTKRERISAGINRMQIFEVPVTDTRSLWKDTRVSKDNRPIPFSITVGIEYEGKVQPCRLLFTRRDTETIYCKPCQDAIDNEDMLSRAAHMNFSLLYPMSGIEVEEILAPEGRVNVLMGQGQTANVLRNLCYMIAQNGEQGKADWVRIQQLVQRLFLVDLGVPSFNKVRGNIFLSYGQHGVENELDISLAGRGLQQMLLVLAYLYSHRSEVLLIDEPDAHLEILRQRQVYEILKDVAEENECQVIIATHSEVILEASIDTNSILLINGEAIDLATQQDMKASLRSIGIEHYYKARVRPRILYIEGSTDIEMLSALARKLDHPATELLSDRLNYFYTQDVCPEDDLLNRLDRAGGASVAFRKHFYALRRFVPDFRGVALFDSDRRGVSDDIKDELAVLYWEDYELENYFITPDVILRFVDATYDSEGSLFKSSCHESIERVMDACLVEEVFDGDKSQLDEFKRASGSLQRTLLRNVKMSAFAEKVFSRFAEERSQPILLNKGEFCQLVKYAEVTEIPGEVKSRLDTLVAYLSISEEQASV